MRNPDPSKPESGLITNVVRSAKHLATVAHLGQTDKAGQPYITHPSRVAARLAASTDNVQAVAWLHDVVEDCDVTFDDLRDNGYPEEVIWAVEALTRRREESPKQYYARVRRNPIALEVKLADIADNSDPDRLAKLDAATRRRLVRKYDHARAELNRLPD